MNVLSVPLLMTLGALLLVMQVMGPRTQHRSSPRLELRWAMAAGLLFGVLSTWVLSSLYVSGAACAPDFFEYCQAMLYLDDTHNVFPEKRSRAAALLPHFFATKTGILDGLAMAGVFCSCVTGTALFLWARQLGGRSAGILCIGISLAMAPMVALPRFLAFYPEICASLCLAAAGTTAAILKPDRNRLLLAGSGIGLCLLMDVRALLWALPYLGGTLLAALLARGTARDRAIRVIALLLPLVISYLLGSLAYGEDATSLETQLDIRPLFYQHGVTAPGFEPPHERTSSYIWGRSSPLDLPSTLGFIWEQKQLEATVSSPLPPANDQIRMHHEAWEAVLGVGGVLGVLALIRSPRTLLALLVTVLPFWISFRNIGGMAEATPRFYTHALPGLAVLVATGAGAALRQIPRWRGLRLPSSVRAPILSGLLLALVMGWIPSWMAPDATWRSPLGCWDKPLQRLPEYHGATTTTARLQVECADAVYGDESAERLPLRTFNLP